MQISQKIHCIEISAHVWNTSQTPICHESLLIYAKKLPIILYIKCKNSHFSALYLGNSTESKKKLLTNFIVNVPKNSPLKYLHSFKKQPVYLFFVNRRFSYTKNCIHCRKTEFTPTNLRPLVFSTPLYALCCLIVIIDVYFLFPSLSLLIFYVAVSECRRRRDIQVYYCNNLLNDN